MEDRQQTRGNRQSTIANRKWAEPPWRRERQGDGPGRCQSAEVKAQRSRRRTGWRVSTHPDGRPASADPAREGGGSAAALHAYAANPHSSVLAPSRTRYRHGFQGVRAGRSGTVARHRCACTLVSGIEKAVPVPTTIPGSGPERCREGAIPGSGAAFRGPGNDSPGAGSGVGRGVTGRVRRRVCERDVRGVSPVEGRVVAAGVARGVGSGVARTEGPRVDGREGRMVARRITRRICRRESWRESEGESETDSEVASRRARPRADFRLQIDDCRWQSAEREVRGRGPIPGRRARTAERGIGRQGWLGTR